MGKITEIANEFVDGIPELDTHFKSALIISSISNMHKLKTEIAEWLMENAYLYVSDTTGELHEKDLLEEFNKTFSL